MSRRIDPPCSIQRHPSSGDDAVQVIMIQQRLTPGVQHGRNADLGLESSLSKLQERLAGGREQKLEECWPVLPEQSVECGMEETVAKAVIPRFDGLQLNGALLNHVRDQNRESRIHFAP